MISLKDKIIKESIFKIGTVSSIEGRTVIIRINKNKNHSHILYMGDIIKNVVVGGYIKITKGFTKIIGKVEEEYISEEKHYNQEYKKAVYYCKGIKNPIRERRCYAKSFISTGLRRLKNGLM